MHSQDGFGYCDELEIFVPSAPDNVSSNLLPSPPDNVRIFELDEKGEERGRGDVDVAGRDSCVGRVYFCFGRVACWFRVGISKYYEVQLEYVAGVSVWSVRLPREFNTDADIPLRDRKLLGSRNFEKIGKGEFERRERGQGLYNCSWQVFFVEEEVKNENYEKRVKRM